MDAANQIIFGKAHKMRLALCCLIARNHFLIEDIPGVWKTQLANTLAKLLGLNCQRIQFTSDILPAAILGASIFDPKNLKITGKLERSLLANIGISFTTQSQLIQ